MQGTLLSPKTINTRISAVKSRMRLAAEVGLLAEEVAQRFARVRGVTEQALKERLKTARKQRITPEEMRRLCEQPDPTTYAGARDRALLLTLASSGLRVSELVALTAAQLKHSGGSVVLEVVGKNAVKARRVPLSAEAHTSIEHWQAQRAAGWRLAGRTPRTTHLFTVIQPQNGLPGSRPVTDERVRQIVDAYATLAGLTGVHPHSFRYFVGTELCLRRGLHVAQQALGHRSPTTTTLYALHELPEGVTDGLF